TADNAHGGFKEVQVLQPPPPPPTHLKYTAELASTAVGPTVWTCGRNDRHNRTVLDPITNQRPFFAFVHVYKTAGSTIRDFFREYAMICKKSLAIVVSCRGFVDVDQCRFKFGVNTPKQHESVNDAILRDHYDILGGHFSFGMADHIFSNATVTTTATFSPQNRNGAAPQEIFEHVLGHIGTSASKEEEVKGLFSRYIGGEVSRNVSQKKSISTGSVLEELNKDDEFMVVFREFVKYEQMIVDFAMDMHQKQYDAVTTKSLH
ncbi:hypothetical protein ACHAWC_002972, partial [Mediolabrus comicus]